MAELKGMRRNEQEFKKIMLDGIEKWEAEEATWEGEWGKWCEVKGERTRCQKGREPKQKSRAKVEQKQKCWSACGWKVESKSKSCKELYRCIVVSMYCCIVVSRKESCNDIENWKGVSVVICTGAWAWRVSGGTQAWCGRASCTCERWRFVGD